MKTINDCSTRPSKLAIFALLNLGMNQTSSEALSDIIIKGIEEKKGNEIVLLDLREISSAVCDFFIICHGNSDTQVKSIAESIEDEVRIQLSEKPWHVEGKDNAEWILLDYSNVVVHIFQKNTRDFFKLEDLWADAKATYIKSEE